MKTFFTAASLAAGASAATLPRNDACCFQLTASGGTSGTLGQLDDGQNRVGGGLGSATYCIKGDSITDESGRGCILTPPTTQFQCDKGASPDGGFSVSSDGMLEHNGDSNFYACPADQGEYNIYTEKVDGQPKCVEVTLSTGGKCAAGGMSSMSSVQSSVQTCPPAQTVTKTEQGKASTVYKTETIQTTQVKPTTEYKTETQVKPTTIYKTETVQNTQVKPTTVYQTKTVEETETATKPTTVYETKTIQKTETAKQPTTIYKTVEETETATKPTTVYETKTIQQIETAKQPTTVYQTKTIEETETMKATPMTQYVTKTEQGKASTITKVVTQVETSMGAPQTITKTEQYCSQSQGGNKPTYGGGQPTQTQQGSACPTDLSGPYQSPHLIVPVSSEHPDQSYGTSYSGMMNQSMSSVFNFDIPQSYEGKTCSLVFLFPQKSDLETSDYDFNGQGSVSVDHLNSVCGKDATWNSVPSVADHMGEISPQPGNSYVVSTESCAAGTTQSYELSAAGGLDLEYFQDYNPSPIGLYITSC